MITFNGIPVIQVKDGDGGGCNQCVFENKDDFECLMVTMHPDWSIEEERNQFGGECVENNAHYELDEKE
jgi:hypothetical protein